MTNAQKIQLVRAKQDAIMDATSLAVFALMVYFVLNPDKYDRITTGVQEWFNKVGHRISVWQTRLAIRSLPETDTDE